VAQTGRDGFQFSLLSFRYCLMTLVAMGAAIVPP
jgi:hypothetical protein